MDGCDPGGYRFLRIFQHQHMMTATPPPFNLLRLAIEPNVEKFKRDNKGEKEAIVENDESEGGSKLGKAVPASEITWPNKSDPLLGFSSRK